jgi:hypothetical protein
VPPSGAPPNSTVRDRSTPSPEPITGRQFMGLMFDEARRVPKLGTYNRTMMRLGGLFSSVVREFREMLY